MPFDREKLKKRRIDMGITLQEVADAIGVEKPTVQRYESGKIKKIDTMTVEKLACAVKCSPAYLMGWQATPQVQRENRYTLTAHEEEVISAYREATDMQTAIDKILGICSESKPVENPPFHLPDMAQISKDAQELKRKAISAKILQK